MNHPRNKTVIRGYQLSAEAVRYLSDNHARPYSLTPEGNAEMEKQSHRQLVDEAISEMEQEEAARAETPNKPDRFSILMDCSNRLHERWLSLFEKLQALPHEDFVNREAVAQKIRNVQKASRRVTRKMTWLLEIQRDSL